MLLRFLLALIGSQLLTDAQSTPEPAQAWPDDLLSINDRYLKPGGLKEIAAVHLENVGSIGRGIVKDLLWNAATNEIIVIATDGIWTYDATNILAGPSYADIPTQRIGGSQSALSYQLLDENTIKVFDMQTSEFVFSTTFETREYFRYQTITPDGTRIINGRHGYATPFQGLELWDTTAQSHIALSPQASAGAYNQLPIITSDSRYMIGLHSEYIRIWDLRDGTLVAEYVSGISETWEPASMYLHPNDKTLILSREGDPLEVWDIEDNSRHTIPNPHEEEINQIIFNENGQVMATHDASGHTVIWNSELQIIEELTIDPDFPYLAISPDGQQIATVSQDHRIQLLGIHDGAELVSTPPHSLGNIQIKDDSIVSIYQDQLTIRHLPAGNFVWQTKLEENASAMAILPFRTWNFFDAIIWGTQSGQLHAVLLLLSPSNDEEFIYVTADLLSAHTAETSITQIARVTLPYETMATFEQGWMGDLFITLNENNQLIFWILKPHNPSDVNPANPEISFTPMLEQSLFIGPDIDVFEIATQNEYLAAATSNGIYVWDIEQLILEDNLTPTHHYQDPIQPRMHQVVWLEDTQLVYGGENGVVTLIDLADPTYHAQWSTGLANITSLAAFDSLIFAGGCADTSTETHPVEPIVYTECTSFGFEIFYTDYNVNDWSLMPASPEIKQIHDQMTEIEGFFRYRDAILIDNGYGTLEVWGVLESEIIGP